MPQMMLGFGKRTADALEAAHSLLLPTPGTDTTTGRPKGKAKQQVELQRAHEVRVQLRPISMGGQFLAVAMNLGIQVTSVEKQLGMSKKRRTFTPQEKVNGCPVLSYDVGPVLYDS